MLASEALFQKTRALFGGRVYPNAAAEDEPAPFMVYTESGDKENTIDGGFIGLSRVAIDAWIFADSYSAVKELKDQVIAAMEAPGQHRPFLVIRDDYSLEPQTGYHLIVIKFSTWESRE